MFLITLSFLCTTPKVTAEAGFLIKDLILLGGCILTAGEALLARKRFAAASLQLHQIFQNWSVHDGLN
jgi:uncharacterized membrane protein YkgB